MVVEAVMNDSDAPHRGRPRSIPESHFVAALRLRLAGLGYRAIANELSRQGLATSHGSVARFIKRQKPYDSS